MAYGGSIAAATADDAYTATLQEFSTEVKKQTFDKMPAVARLWRNKGTGTAGSNRHEWILRAGRNSNAKTLTSDADTVDFSAQQHVVTAWYDYMAFLAVPVQGSLLRNSINSGKAQKVNLMKEDMRQAEETMRYMISSQSFGDGSGKTIIGLSAILPTTGVGSNTLYGVPEASASFWKNYYLTSFGSFAANGLHGSADDKLTRAHLVCSDNGAQTPDTYITDRSFVEYFIRAEGQKKRITKDADFGKIGSGALSQEAGRGLPIYDAELFWDTECPSGRAYILHSEDFELIEDPNFNFKWIGPIPLGKQFLLEGRVLTYRAQSKVTRRNWNGVLDGITA